MTNFKLSVEWRLFYKKLKISSIFSPAQNDYSFFSLGVVSTARFFPPRFSMKLLYKLVYKTITLYWKLFKPITIGARLLMVKDGTVVLVKHTYDQAWYLPGGGLKRGETLEQAIRREAAEEVANLPDIFKPGLLRRRMGI